MLNGLFKVNKANLALARATVRKYGEAWLHGCGNIYVTKQDSDFRKEFTNPNRDNTAPSSAYVLHLKSLSDVPQDEQEAEDRLIKAKAQETRETQRQKTTSKVHTVSVEEDDLHEDDRSNPDTVKQMVAAKPISAKDRGVIQTAAQAQEVKAAKASAPQGAPASQTTAADLIPEDKGFEIQDKEPAIIDKKGGAKPTGAGITI